MNKELAIAVVVIFSGLFLAFIMIKSILLWADHAEEIMSFVKRCLKAFEAVLRELIDVFMLMLYFIATYSLFRSSGPDTAFVLALIVATVVRAGVRYALQRWGRIPWGWLKRPRPVL